MNEPNYVPDVEVDSLERALKKVIAGLLEVCVISVAVGAGFIKQMTGSRGCSKRDQAPLSRLLLYRSP